MLALRVPSFVLSCGGGGGRSFAMMGKKVVVAVKAVEAVSSSRLAQGVRVVRICLCTLSMCEAMPVDMTSPSDCSKWVRWSIDL